jgi:hypothetical protein
VSPNENRPEDGDPGAVGDEQLGGSNVTSTVPRHPAAFASLYAPAGRRTMWWFTYRCPCCKAGHFARVRERASASGTRRTGCGRLVWVVVARTYAPEGAR